MVVGCRHGERVSAAPRPVLLLVAALGSVVHEDDDDDDDSTSVVFLVCVVSRSLLRSFRFGFLC